MATRFRLSPRAERDVDHIWNHTDAVWGSDQANRYIESLKDCIFGISDYPGRGQPVLDIGPDYRCVRCGSHVVFYRQGENEVIIVRILHNRMNFAAHLPT